MTNTLTEHRDILKDILTSAGIENAYVIIPARATPPLIFVGPGTPYVSYDGATFGSFIGHFDVGVVAGRGSNETAAEELDDQILTVLDAIAADGRFQANDVDRPGAISINGQTYLACSIDVQTEIHR